MRGRTRSCLSIPDLGTRHYYRHSDIATLSFPSPTSLMRGEGGGEEEGENSYTTSHMENLKCNAMVCNNDLKDLLNNQPTHSKCHLKLTLCHAQALSLCRDNPFS